MHEGPWPMRRDGLLFREAVASDIEALQAFRNDPGVNHFMVRTFVDPDDLRREWLAVPSNPTDYSCVVELDGRVVAMGFLDVVDGPGQPGRPTGTDGVIGYIVDPRVAGRGVGTATARALLCAAFDGLGLRRVTAAANADNIASVAVLQRAGMRRGARGPQGLVAPDPWLAGRGGVCAARRGVGAVPRSGMERDLMSEQFYSDATLYDRLFPGREQAVDFYRTEADQQGGSVPELGSGTGRKLIPIASDGHPCAGLELSPHMLAEARRKADERGVDVEWVQGDMREFDLDRTFDLVLIAANSLLHLLEAEDLVRCFRSVRRHWRPERGSASTCSTRACTCLPEPTARDAGATRCRSWIPIVASCMSMSRRPTTRPRR
ncbi:bifunctional GNAT family N-acetyltransferase/class I SAM-dependent methyltransferase [Nocardioides sp. B-3]|uniref:bifunctional GNAT family N-acetyltransferase/class I SAM-dependent methyltransferase n=1 Tax=Nocardioides sp. B-3 TaxID=2895565 RepID=UPI0021531C7A|nr:bifunctional GNAT family N-acetyltransferase/class I SAM-dependent methyltransferase [Nocardioides sp. B-3]UUZ58047.1 bifunctional GNAT family N-acetyltransferase/class I SAM-dependent methyltransferase [Nocardioides sp. B-3]